MNRSLLMRGCPDPPGTLRAARGTGKRAGTPESLPASRRWGGTDPRLQLRPLRADSYEHAEAARLADLPARRDRGDGRLLRYGPHQLPVQRDRGFFTGPDPAGGPA